LGINQESETNWLPQLSRLENCAEESLIKTTHDDIDAFTEKLTEGHAWKTDIDTELASAKANSRGVKLRSWNCQ